MSCSALVVLLAGCGQGDATGRDRAADRPQTMRFEATWSYEVAFPDPDHPLTEVGLGFGRFTGALPSSAQATYEGEVDLDRESVGMSVSSEAPDTPFLWGTGEIVWIDEHVYMDAAYVESYLGSIAASVGKRVAIPPDADWFVANADHATSLDARLADHLPREVADDFPLEVFLHGVDVNDPTALFTELGDLTSDVKRTGTDVVRDMETAQWRATVAEAEDLLGMAPPSFMLGMILEPPPGPYVVDTWIDETGAPRRIAVEAEHSEDDGTTIRMAMTIEFFDEGRDVSIEAPPAERVVDYFKFYSEFWAAYQAAHDDLESIDLSYEEAIP
jgi:hypothetical protein